MSIKLNNAEKKAIDKLLFEHEDEYIEKTGKQAFQYRRYYTSLIRYKPKLQYMEYIRKNYYRK